MFLATTALSEFWDRQQPLLFLGTWCLRGDRRREWEGLRYEVMKNPWDDRERYHASARYLDQFCERMVAALGDYLGTIHGQRRSLRFWRILLGPWALASSHAAYDRYVCLKQALDSGDVETKGLDPAAYKTVATTADHLQWMLDDLGNLQLYTQLLEEMGVDLRRCTPQSSDPPAHGQPRRSSFRRAFHRAGRLLLGRFSRTALLDLYARASDDWRLSVRSGFRVMPLMLDVNAPRCEPQWNAKRMGLTDLLADTEFERLFSHVLPWQLPTAFLEGYDTLNSSGASLPANVETIVSAVGWYGDDAVKFVLADAADHGKRLIALQHGAGYGQFRSAPAENHEKRLADEFFVWGWADQLPQKLRNVPGVTLSRLAAARHSSGRERTVLFVGTAHPRYLYRFHSCPVGNQWVDYFAAQRTFLNLTAPLHRVLVYRPYPVDYGHGLRERIVSEFPALTFDGQTPTARAFRSARVVVVDHCGTTLQEALAADIPTILYWDPERWETRPEAADDFRALREARILHFTPEAAATHLNSVYDDLDSWWRDAQVRQALRRFVSRHALASPRWTSEWSSALRRELKSNKTHEIRDVPD